MGGKTPRRVRASKTRALWWQGRGEGRERQRGGRPGPAWPPQRPLGLRPPDPTYVGTLRGCAARPLACRCSQQCAAPRAAEEKEARRPDQKKGQAVRIGFQRAAQPAQRRAQRTARGRGCGGTLRSRWVIPTSCRYCIAFSTSAVTAAVSCVVAVQ